MQSPNVSHEQILRMAQFSAEDLTEINQRRRAHNQLGFAYQLAFVRLTNRFPIQQPLEVNEELLTFVSVQLAIPAQLIQVYTQRRSTLSEHQEWLRSYLNLRRFGEPEVQMLEQFLFAEACRLEQTGPLLNQAKQFLREADILYPADDTLRRLIAGQRQQARDYIFVRITDSLAVPLREKLDALLVAGDKRLTPFQALKQPPGRPAPTAMLRLTVKLEQIRATEVLTVDLTWLNNNYQRSLTHYAQRCSADRMRGLRPEHRYAVLVCFLWQVHRDTIDYLVDMHDKLMTGVHNRAQEDIDEELRKRRQMIRSVLATYRTVGNTVLDSSIDDRDLRQTLFNQVDPERLARQMASVERLLTGKHSHVLNLVVDRFSYLRQFAPAFLEHLEFHLEEGAQSTIVEATRLLRDMNRENRRKLPEDAPTEFIPKKLRSLVEQDGMVDKHAWECVLLTAIRDEIRAGNILRQAEQTVWPLQRFLHPRRSLGLYAGEFLRACRAASQG